ncbi:MAG: PaaI family thioesterase [Salibacteraceae bacterium]
MKDLLNNYNAQNKFGQLLDMDYQIISEGEIEYKMKIKAEHIAINNTAHGGCIAGMMDAVLGMAALSKVANENKYVATIEFKIDYLNPAKIGDELIGIGTVIQKGKRLIFAEGKIMCNSATIAKASGTFTAYPAQKHRQA